MKKRNKTLDNLVQPVLFLIVLAVVFSLFAVPMGISNMLNTMMNTAYRLLMDTALYIMAIAVIAGALSALLAEFGVVDLLNKLLSPLMRPLYGMPGAAALGIVTTYLSDNPAILALADDREFRRYFKAYQIPALTNLGTAFGMGLIVSSFVLGLSGRLGEQTGLAVLCGNLGAVIGSVVSTRLMLRGMKKALGSTEPAAMEGVAAVDHPNENRDDSPKGWVRILDALVSGGKKGVELGLGIIPGLLIICTIVMMLTNGSAASGIYTGAAYEGIGLLPKVAEKLELILKPVFGFSGTACIAVPVTALGSAGAALGLIPRLVEAGQANCRDVAVFVAMCMCWSGYLSTHVSMMDVLRCSRFTGRAILSHTIGGLAAGVAANWLFQLFTLWG